MHRSLNAAGVFSGYIYSEVPRYLPDYEPNAQARYPDTPMHTAYYSTKQILEMFLPEKSPDDHLLRKLAPLPKKSLPFPQETPKLS